MAAGLAYRQWAIDNRSAFLLIFGTPLPDFEAPEDGPTTEAAERFGQVFLDVIFVGWSEAELRETQLGPELDGLAVELTDFVALRQALTGTEALFGLGPAASALFMTAWGTLHGIVMLELIGQMPWLGDHGADMCRVALMHFWPTVERVHAEARTPGSYVRALGSPVCASRPGTSTRCPPGSPGCSPGSRTSRRTWSRCRRPSARTALFPYEDLAALGYEAAHNGDGRWNGSAVLSRVGLEDVALAFDGQPPFVTGDALIPPAVEARAVGATCGGLRFWSLYVPNGRGVDDPHYAYKLAWLRRAPGRARERADPAGGDRGLQRGADRRRRMGPARRSRGRRT